MIPSPVYEISYVGEDDAEYFHAVDGRLLNTMNPRYLLPSDQDEVRRSELHHRMLQFVFGGKNYVGPVQDVLQLGQERRVLDLGTGGGFWAVDIADEFPRAEVTGVDLAPIQPRSVPPNCTFELCDLDQWHLPYPDNHFDLIHARSMHTGIHNYPRFLHEIARLLRPGGLVIIVEGDIAPTLDGPSAAHFADDCGLHNWFMFWDTYRACLKKQGIDVTVPRRLTELLATTGRFKTITTHESNIPIGFWPKDPLLLTVGQLAWLQCDYLLPALRPLFLSSGIPESKVKALIEDAQQDLYYPPVQLSGRLRIVHAIKR